MSFIAVRVKELVISFFVGLAIVVFASSFALAAPYGCGEFGAGEFNEGELGSCATTTTPDSDGDSDGSGGLADTGQTVWLVRGGAVLLIIAGLTVAVVTHRKNSKKSYKVR